jgi:hypothetical protein
MLDQQIAPSIWLFSADDSYRGYMYPPIGYYSIGLSFQKKASSSRRAVIFWSEPKTYQFYPKIISTRRSTSPLFVWPKKFRTF